MSPGEWACTLHIARHAPSAELQAAVDAVEGLPLSALGADVAEHVLICRAVLASRRVARWLVAHDAVASLKLKSTAVNLTERE